MENAPERIFADRGPRGGLIYREQRMPDTEAEYVRADIHATLAAENERLTKERDQANADRDRWYKSSFNATARTEASAAVKVKETLEAIKDAIIRADPNVLTDTLWMPDDVFKGGTVVDFIDYALSDIEPAAPQEAEAVAWTVRDNPDESDEFGAAYDVLLPSGDWRTCVAVDPSDARDTIRNEWLSGQKRLAAYVPPADYTSPPAHAAANTRKFKLGDRVTKTKGTKWTGRVVGFYSTEFNPVGYCVESETEIGSVQIYPEAALTAAQEASHDPA